ncbi:thiamine biosynthesis lipoprotein [Paenibacillus phyllosphaerae]|uniref:FAD:protein FMN transferase n=1 Tax=Paenibacillus phyllosphaerae TaxID=274593 RepID=A0A7W5AY97_9BACL|nr:FAD:protein FMN transferase [Paenibacillus phyllosphaerae]MBB3110709.1 thiamine biosynthesis lipoprotein [Paenibacillus phyllosphaerae]
MPTEQLMPVMLHAFQFRAMNTKIEIALRTADMELVAKAKAFAADWFRFAEQRFSRFRTDSELSLLNRAGGKPYLVSESMLEVLSLTKHYEAVTEGAFSPFVLSAMHRAGYRDSFERMQTDPLTYSGLETPGYEPASLVHPVMVIDRGMRAVTLPQGHPIDLGGIVKSWAVNRLGIFLRTRLGIAHGLINAGGDLTTWGTRTAEGEPWTVTAEHPWEPEKSVGTVKLSGPYASAATSSKLGRSWTTASGAQHHLIDPSTMAPSRSDVVQCTVVGTHAADCEVWAKTICILGLHEGAARMARQAPGYEALVFTADGAMVLIADVASVDRRWAVPGAAVLLPSMLNAHDTTKLNREASL